MKTFNEFVESQSIDPILEELTLTLFEMDCDPWEELRSYCRGIHPHLELVYTEEINRYNKAFAALQEGEIDEGIFGNVANWASNAWDRAKNSSLGRLAGSVATGVGNAANDAVRMAGAKATDLSRWGQGAMQNAFGPEKKFTDAFRAVQALQQSLQSPEVQQLAQSGKLTMDTPQGKMDALAFFKNVADTMQANNERLKQALLPQRDAARVKDLQQTIAGDPRMRGTRAANATVQPGAVPIPQAAPGAAPAAIA